MAGNLKSEKKLDIKWASMSLHWGQPTGADFEPWLKNVKEIGYDGITCFAENLTDYFGKPDELTRILKNAGLELAAIDIQMESPPELYDQVMDLMNGTGCRILVCIVHMPHEKTPELYKKYADMLNSIGERAAKRDICVHLHNNSDSIGRNFADWRSLMPLIDWEHVYLMADTGHATKDFDEGPHNERAYKFLEANWDKIHYLEFKDYSPEGDMNITLGKGLCDYERIFALMNERGYAGWITIEQNGLLPGADPYKDALASLEFARNRLLAAQGG